MIEGLRRRVFAISSFFLALLVNGVLILSLLPDDVFGGYRVFLAAILVIITQLVIALRWRARVTRTTWMAIGLIIGEALALLCALSWGGSTEYGVWKYSTFLLTSVLPFLAVTYNYQGRAIEVMDLIKCLFIMSLAPLALPIVMPELQDTATAAWQLSVSGIDVITLARCCGIGSLIGFAFAFRAKGVRKVLLLAVCIALAMAQVFIGERAPLIALAAGLLYISLKHVNHPVRRRKRFSFGAILILVGLLCGIPLIISQVPRFGWEELANDPRLVILNDGVEAFRSAPFLGQGLGTFSNAFQATGARHYAHNLFLELLSESGMFGVIFAVVLFFLVFNRFRDRVFRQGDVDDLSPIIARGLVLFSFVAVQFSGDLATNGLFWMSSALVLATTPHKQHSRSKQPQRTGYRTKPVSSAIDTVTLYENSAT